MATLPRLSLVEGAFEELSLELATFIDSLKGEGSNVVGEITPLLADAEKAEQGKETDKDAVLKKLVSASAVLNSAPEREVQAAYDLLIHLVSQAPEPDTYLPPICKYLSSPITTSPQNGTGIALGIFGTVFNSIEPDDDTRYHVLLAILDLLRKSSNFDAVEPQLKNLDDWIQQWELDPQEVRKLTLAVSETAAAAGRNEVSYAYVLKALRTLQKEPTSTEAHDLSLKALKDALQNEKHFDFEDLTSLDSIQALRKSDESTWFELLELFSSDSYDDLQEFKEANASFLASSGLNEDILDRKMRLLTLASLAAHASNTRTLAYSQIAKALNIPHEDIESWVIDTIRSGLVEGKLSQQKQEFLIHRSTYRVFGENQWREVASRLETWRASLVNVLHVIRHQKEEYIKERENELNNAQNTSGQGYRPNHRQRNAPAIEVE